MVQTNIGVHFVSFNDVSEKHFYIGVHFVSFNDVSEKHFLHSASLHSDS